MGIAQLVRADRAALAADALLREPPSALLGVDAEAADALAKLDIRRIFDLALSELFESATRIAQTEGELGAKDLSVLSGLDGTISPSSLADALGVPTVRDLAFWPPYGAARTILDAAFNGKGPSHEDTGTPSDLLPGSGEYPTERVYYNTLVIDHIEDQPTSDLATAAPLDLTSVEDEYGFEKVAEGALLTYSQSWYRQGLALGQLLHSLALAPGEATRLAMVDWSRRAAGTSAETGAEEEDLVNTTSHTRAINEVTSAVATESQSGFSKTASSSFAQQQGSASGGLGVSPFGISLGGESSGTALNKTKATSFSTSSGRRELNASMAQNISDATHQAAHAARNRRATVVEEVAESEKATASTRIVANYNHMHALTVSYYEVLQLYRSEVAVETVEKCLFVPVRLIDFAAQTGLSSQQRLAIAGSALDPRVGESLMLDEDLIKFVLKPKDPIVFPLYDPVKDPHPDEPEPKAIKPVLPTRGELRRTFGDSAERLHNDGLRLPLSATTVGATLVGAHDGDALKLTLTNGAVRSYTVSGGRAAFGPGMPLTDITAIDFLADKETDAGATVSLNLSPSPAAATGAVTDAGTVSATIPIGGAAAGDQVSLAATEFPEAQLDAQMTLAHLQSNRLYYNQVLWESLDAATIALLLSPYTYRGKALLAQIDPTPVGIVGNFLVFRMPVDPSPAGGEDGSNWQTEEGSKWRTWLDDHGFSVGDTGAISREVQSRQLIPLPSGGVFAEAVLGRANAAEKLDLTRFWNWQDSPTPLQPPEIAPVGTESRAQGMELEPGQFSAPLVNIVGPTALPDPQGMAATLNAISNGNMFRDMSGLAATVGLAQAGMAAASQGATAAGAQAGANMATAADFAKEMARLAVSAYTGVPVAGGAGPGKQNISNAGAAINQGRKMDAEAAAAGSVAGPSGAPAINAGGGTSQPAGGQRSSMPAASVSPAGMAPSASLERQAFESTLGSGGGSGLGAMGQFANAVTGAAMGAAPAVSPLLGPTISGIGVGYNVVKDAVWTGATADITYKLAHLEGRKHPDDDPEYGKRGQWRRATPVEVKAGHLELGLATQYADFQVDWFYNGYSLGPIRVTLAGTSDAFGYKLEVEQFLTVRPDLEELPGESDPNKRAAVELLFQYKHRGAVFDDQIIHYSVRLFGDGTALLDEVEDWK